MKIGRSAAELLRTFNFQNGGCPTCCIFKNL